MSLVERAKSKNILRCTGGYLWDYRLGYSLIKAISSSESSEYFYLGQGVYVCTRARALTLSAEHEYII